MKRLLCALALASSLSADGVPLTNLRYEVVSDPPLLRSNGRTVFAFWSGDGAAGARPADLLLAFASWRHPRP